MKMRSLTAGVLLVSVLSAAAWADTVSLNANLKGSQEVPANDTSGTGMAAATYDTASKLLKWTVTYAGLTGPATMAHIHGPAEPGKNAGVVIAFTSPDSPITGSATLTDAQAADLLAGKYYVNVHTAANKSGEIRGQLAPSK